MYAIVAGFDPQTEERIKKLWRGLAKERISDYATRVVDRQPHITLATFEKIIDDQAFQECLLSWRDSHSPLTFQVTGIGSFLGSEALYLAPLVTKSLLDFHDELHQVIEPYVVPLSHSLYAPDRWLPHITLANYMTKEQLSQAMTYCKAQQSSFVGEIRKIQLLYFPEDRSVETLVEVFL